MKYIEVKLPKCTVFITSEEVQEMLKQNPSIYKKGLKRGKGILRHRQQVNREKQKRFEKV